MRIPSGYRLADRVRSRKVTEARGQAEVVSWRDPYILIDVDEEGVPVGIGIHSLASRNVDLTRLDAEGPIFGLVRKGDSVRRVS